MIDRKARDELAVLVKAFVAGRITNFEYEGRLPVTKAGVQDRIINVVDDYIWTCYDDFKEHNMPKGSFSLSSKKELGRIILFLNSDQEYMWPDEPSLTSKLKKLFTATQPVQGRRLKGFDFHNAGDVSVWPFLHRKNMMAEANKPRVGLSLKLAES